MSAEDAKIRHQPWYKERIRTKYIKSLDKNEPSKMLIGKNWTFLKDGMDDFRDGLPPPVDESVIITPNRGPAPNIKGSSESLSTIKQPLVTNRFDKHEICYSKCTPLQQQRRDHIDEIEFGLMQHPLALYPHLEECMPPDVFEDVVDILDPEMNLGSDEDDDNDDEDTLAEAVSSELPSTPQPNPNIDSKDERRDDDRSAASTTTGFRYQLPRSQEEKEKRDRRKAQMRPESPSQIGMWEDGGSGQKIVDEHIKQVTKEFCDWVASLGGESNNIEETTITSLFASGYETKPALSVPIHVVELTNVPPELRMSATGPQPQPMVKNIPTTDMDKDDWKLSGEYAASASQHQYGAWYLPTHMWKKRVKGEQLQDPKELKDLEESEAKKRSNALDAELAPMHGAKSFMDFIGKKNVRRPEFLDRVSEYQAKAAEEERLRQEAEAAKQKRQRFGPRQSSTSVTS